MQDRTGKAACPRTHPFLLTGSASYLHHFPTIPSHYNLVKWLIRLSRWTSQDLPDSENINTDKPRVFFINLLGISQPNKVTIMINHLRFQPSNQEEKHFVVSVTHSTVFYFCSWNRLIQQSSDGILGAWCTHGDHRFLQSKHLETDYSCCWC